MEQKPFPNSDDNTDRETGSITQAAASAQTLREMGLARIRGTQAAPTTLPRSPSPWWAARRKKVALLSFLLHLLQHWAASHGEILGRSVLPAPSGYLGGCFLSLGRGTATQTPVKLSPEPQGPEREHI